MMQALLQIWVLLINTQYKRGFSIMKKASKLMALCLCVSVLMSGASVNAFSATKTVVGFVPTENGIQWQYSDGTYLKNDWLNMGGMSFHFDSEGNLQTGMVTIGSNTYYFDANGTMVTDAFRTVGEDLYYFTSDGSMAKNTTVDGNTIGEDGRVVKEGTTEVTEEAGSAGVAIRGDRTAIYNTCMAIIAGVTTPDMTNEQKLRACYDWVMDYTSYKRTYETPEGDWTANYAMDVYTTGKGNCYRYAAAFAYLAKALGYEAKIDTGRIQAARGGTTPHGWCEVKVGDTWYLFDPDMEDAKHVRSYYKLTYAEYPVKPLNKERDWEISF